MQEVEKPFGVKLMFFALLLAGLFGIYASIFASDEFVREFLLNDKIIGAIGGSFSNISFLKAALLLLSIFALWLSSGVFSLKRSAWYCLLALILLPIAVSLIALATLTIHNIDLENIQKISVAFRVLADIVLFAYIFSRQDYFVF